MNIVKEEFLGLCERLVIDTRKRLDKIHDSKGIYNPTYIGDCNRAAIIFYMLLHRELYQYAWAWISYNNIEKSQFVTFDETIWTINKNPFDSFDIKCELVHGELTHCDQIPEQYWLVQHTIVTVKNGDQLLYIDPTAEQFQDVCHNIDRWNRGWYLSEKKPWYFYPDSENPEFNKSLNKDGK